MLIVEDTILVPLEEAEDGNNNGIDNGPSIEDINNEEERRNRNRLVTRKCLPILQQLLADKHSWIFEDEVDPPFLDLPDYFEVVKQPMHLRRVREKLDSATYEDTASFHRDVSLVFDNSILYYDYCTTVEALSLNHADSHLKDIAKRMKGDFETEYNRVCGEDGV